jgi:phage-related protein
LYYYKSVDDPLRAIKPVVVFVGNSRRDLQAFPQAVRREIGLALFEAQLGDHPAAANPLKGFGSGVLEIRDNYEGDTYRAVYTVRFEGVLYVLHTFQKKSTKGIATPQRQLDLIRQRLRQAEAIHRASKGADL